MSKLIRLSFLLVLISCGTSQNKPQKQMATIDENGYLVGEATKEHFLQEPFITWFSDDYDNYRPDAKIIEQIKPLLKDVTIKAFMGTWCGDSRREVPHFYKILDESGFDYKNLQMITVDRSKKSPTNEQEGLNIIYVPTFIFYKNGVEINRFIEYSQDSLEYDILSILKEEGYKNSYYEG